MQPNPDAPIAVTILDTATGELRRTPAIFGHRWWAEGNGSCDCNRIIMDPPFPYGGECAGRRRYLIVDAEGGHPVSAYNQGYPAELVAAHLDAFVRQARLRAEAELGGIIGDLREDSSAYRRGLADGVGKEGERVLGRIRDAVHSWEGEPDPTLRGMVQAALEELAVCITHRGITHEDALARVRAEAGRLTGREGAEG